VDKLLKNIGVVCLVLLYGFTISFYNSGSDAFNSILSIQNQQAQPGSSKTSIAKSSQILTPPAADVAGIMHPASPAFFKTLPFYVIAFTATTEKILFTRFAQYRLASKNIIPGLCRLDIIFPFHHFW
jgi:hypothetical protein